MLKCIVIALSLAISACSAAAQKPVPSATSAGAATPQSTSSFPEPEPPGEAPGAGAEQAPPAEPPSVALPRERVMALPVEGFGDAVLVLPDDMSQRRPVLIATHGAGDGPEWQCETWQGIVRGRAFILCPRGVRLNADPAVPSGYFYRNHLTLEREVLASVYALKLRFAREADATAIVYTGYSQGATMGVLMLIEHGALFPRLILVEGGNADWSRGMARRYKERGGQRVLFACGGRHCTSKAEKAAQRLSAEQVPARVEHVQGAGHTYGGPVAERVAQTLEWLVEGDPRWGGSGK